METAPYKVIIPNLARRQDRWFTVLGTLIAQGVPPGHIRRFDAHDGARYGNSAAIASAAITNKTLYPRYGNSDYIIENHQGWDPFNYSWNWTWYDIMDSIALEPDDLPPTLVMVDDWMMTISYDEVSHHIAMLSAMPDEFCILQYVHSTSDGAECPTRRDLRPTAVPSILNGIAGTGEACLLVSPKGARRLVDFADSHPTFASEILMHPFAMEADQDGCYSVRENLCEHLAQNHYECFQDRCTMTGGISVPFEPEKG